jgi:hypothetical protein
MADVEEIGDVAHARTTGDAALTRSVMRWMMRLVILVNSE